MNKKKYTAPKNKVIIVREEKTICTSQYEDDEKNYEDVPIYDDEPLTDPWG